jgi:ABC-2 type transport system permease protein
MVTTCIVAPLVLAGILGFAFGAGGSTGAMTIGVSGASSELVAAAAGATQLPHDVSIRRVADAGSLKKEVASGALSAGVILTGTHSRLSDLLIPIVSPGATHSPGFDVVSRPSSLVGRELAESVAAGLASRLYADRLHPGTSTHLAAITVTAHTLGNGAKSVLNYFAASIAVVFLFFGAGLGMRSLMLERSAGTLVRMAAAPIRPIRIVLGKMSAIFITGLVSIFVVWAVTATAFGAHWGDPLGVVLMCVGSTLAMCGLGAFITSLAKDEQAAFGVALIVGLFLALLGGNLLPAGALPPFLQTLSLGTPNGWALVGFGRLSLLGESARAVVGPFIVLCLIAIVTAGLAMLRVQRMVRP